MYSVINNQPVTVNRLITPPGYDLLNSDDPFPYYGALANDPNIPGLFLGNGVNWVSVSGDVEGPPNPVVDGNLVAFDGTTGKIVKDSGYQITDYQSDPIVLTSAGKPDLNIFSYTIQQIGLIKCISICFPAGAIVPINANITADPTVWMSGVTIPAEFRPLQTAQYKFPITITTDDPTLTTLKGYFTINYDGTIGVSINELTGGAVDITIINANGNYL